MPVRGLLGADRGDAAAASVCQIGGPGTYATAGFDPSGVAPRASGATTLAVRRVVRMAVKETR